MIKVCSDFNELYNCMLFLLLYSVLWFYKVHIKYINSIKCIISGSLLELKNLALI